MHGTDQKFTLRVTLLNECLAPHWNISSSETRAVSLLPSVETPVLRAVPVSWCPPSTSTGAPWSLLKDGCVSERAGSLCGS